MGGAPGLDSARLTPRVLLELLQLLLRELALRLSHRRCRLPKPASWVAKWDSIGWTMMLAVGNAKKNLKWLGLRDERIANTDKAIRASQVFLMDDPSRRCCVRAPAKPTAMRYARRSKRTLDGHDKLQYIFHFVLSAGHKITPSSLMEASPCPK